MLSFLLRLHNASFAKLFRFSMLEFNNDVSSVGDCPSTPIYGKLGDWVSAPGDETVPLNIVQVNCSLFKNAVPGLHK